MAGQNKRVIRELCMSLVETIFIFVYLDNNASLPSWSAGDVLSVYSSAKDFPLWNIIII